MVEIKNYCLLILVVTLLASFSVGAAVFELNGTVYNNNGNPLNNTNISIALKDNTWTDLGTNFTTTNSSGWFGLNVTSNVSYFYLLSIFHVNQTYNHIDWVGQSLPSFPYQEFARLGGNLKFYLDEAGTLNITVRNQSNTQIQFAAQVKDVQLGYPVSCSSSNSGAVFTCYVPKNRNYSVMVYPSNSDPGNNRFIPLSYNWNNFSATSSYTIVDNNGAGLSSYNATTSRLDKQFNCTMAFSRITGYLNNTLVGDYQSWTNITIVPYLTEPGNMIFASYGTLPYNMSAWRNQGDDYNKSTGLTNQSGWYNITLPYASAEDTNYILFASANNNSNFTGVYKNITISSANHNLNMTLYGLLGETSSINLSDSQGGNTFSASTKKQRFNFVNSTTNQTLSGISAHIETKLDYTSYGMGMIFTFMDDLSANSASQFFVPMLNVSGVKEINVYSMAMAPKRVPTRTAAQIVANPNITLTTFSPGDIQGEIDDSAVSVSIYKSNSSCDVPVPPASCSLTSTATMDSFNPLSAIIGGGDVSFRVTMDGVTVHYVNVDLFASGPPDAMFDDDDASAERTTDGFSKALRFGSQGPSIYSYILIAIPYTEGSSSTTGLNENSATNLSIPVFYDENWNVVWNTTSNGTSGASLTSFDSHYSTYSSEWQTLMQNTTCTTTVSSFNATTPCYKDTTNNKIWIRLPHFSGNSPQISGAVVTASSSTPPSSGGNRIEETPANATINNQTVKTTRRLAPESSEETLVVLLKNEPLSMSLEPDSEYSFSLTSSSGLTEAHTLFIDEVTESTVTFTISSEPQTFTISVGEFVLIDLDSDGSSDVKVTLKNIIDSSADLEIENILVAETEPVILDEVSEDGFSLWPVILAVVIVVVFGLVFIIWLKHK